MERARPPVDEIGLFERNEVDHTGLLVAPESRAPSQPRRTFVAVGSPANTMIIEHADAALNSGRSTGVPGSSYGGTG